MPSLDSVLTRQALAVGEVRQVGTDTPIAIRLRPLGAAGTVTSVTVVTATSVEIITSGGGTDTYAFSTYATIGALADAINKDGVMEAKVLDALRSGASDDFLLAASPVTAGRDERGNVVYDLKYDTSASLSLPVALSPFRSFDAPKGKRVHLQEIVYSVNMGTAAADSVQIWHRVGSTEVQVFGALSVDTTATTINFASGQGKITSAVDGEFIVLVKDAATLADAAGNFVRVVGTIE